MSELELKPCPFCAAPAELERAGEYWMVGCSNHQDQESDGCAIHPWIVDGRRTKEQASDAWNFRP